MNVYLCFLVCLRFPGFLDLRRVTTSSELKSFLLSMCIDAPESTTNARSSGDFGVGAGVALASIGE